MKKPEIEHDLYLRVVSMSAASAKRFIGLETEPVDLGPPARPERHKPGARVWGFPSRRETASEKAVRIWTVRKGAR